jgi:hypothetical protein
VRRRDNRRIAPAKLFSHPNRGTNPLAAASMRPANGAPTWPGKVSAPVAAQCSSTVRRLARA